MESVDDLATDPNRKPTKSADPAWKYGFYPDLSNRDKIQCTLCNKEMRSGASRLKKHLVGGFKDVTKCPNTTTEIIKEMKFSIDKGKRKNEELQPQDPQPQPLADEYREDDVVLPRSSKLQKTMNFTASQSKTTKSVASMLRKSPEEVVEERHCKGPYQTTIENYTKSEEDKRRVKQHIANFFYENGIPFNAAHSRSYEIMVESIGQFGSGLKPPTYHELRVPLLETAKSETEKIRERHEKSWKQYGCSLMCDGWTDKRTRHLINFLVNSQEGTFFLCSADVSSKVQDASMLSTLIEEQINLVGKDYVVQVVTDNGANFKAAGRKLCERIPTLYWTPCAAHCLDLMLEDIAKLKDFKIAITNGRNITTFIYRHARLLSAMREKTNGNDIVRPATTRFATAFLTLQSLYKNRDGLRKLFGGTEWFDSKLSKTSVGGKVHDAVLSVSFWNNVEDCIRASQPLLVALRIVDADENPALAEISAAMDNVKVKITDSLEKKPRLLAKVLGIINKRWESQMEVELYGAALFLNPGKFFDIKDRDFAYSSRLRMKFNDVLQKMVTDMILLENISNQADHYENSRMSFGKQMAINQRKSKSPLDWWGAFGGNNVELALFAKRIVGLCCSSSGCERNWSTFEFIHTKKRNRLEHQRLNDLVYVQYNRKIATRFQKRRDEGRNFNPLILEDFQWDNEWVNGEIIGDSDGGLWNAVDRALDASEGIENRHSSRRDENRGSSSSSQPNANDVEMEEYENEVLLNDDEDVVDDYGCLIVAPSHENVNELETNEVDIDDFT